MKKSQATETKRSLGPLPLIYPLPALLVGSYDNAGKPNVMTAAWGGICCSEPLCLTVSVRPARWTYDAVFERKGFTVGIPSEDMMVAADYVGIVSGRRYDKFSTAGLTPVRSDLVDAPYVAECPVVLECALTHTLELGTHTMLVGRVLDVKADAACLGPDNLPDPEKVRPLIFSAAGGSYHGIGKRLGKAHSVGKALIKGDEE